jgi:hypothetical protein
LLIQIYDYVCSLHDEVRGVSGKRFGIDDIMLFKVDVSTSIALDQGKRPLYRYTIRAFSPPHWTSISCVQLLLRYSGDKLTRLASVDFSPNEDSNVCDRAADLPTTDDAY